VIVKDYRERWATMDSVKLNNTLQEHWKAVPDSTVEWSHCCVIPLYVTTMSLAGIRPLDPGFGRCEVRPQPADLELLELTVHSVRGPIEFSSRGRFANRGVSVGLPAGCEGELVVDRRERLTLEPVAAGASSQGLTRYRMAGGKSTSVTLKFT
jgi:alpha-L-rhamnosidase